MVRIAWLATHPIQYQAPLLRRLAETKTMSLEAIFFSDFSVNRYHDKEFGVDVAWDVPLIDGYKSVIIARGDSKEGFLKSATFKLSRIKKMLTSDNYDIVVIQGWNHIGYLLGAWWAKRSGLTVLLRCEATDHVTTSRGLMRWVREIVLKWLFSNVDFFAAVGTQNRNFYLRRGISATRIVSMPYCVDNDFFRSKLSETNSASLRINLGLNDDLPILLYVGKLTHRKNVLALLEAYHRLPGPHPWLLIVGEGELNEALRAKKAEFNLEKVKFLGFRNQTDLPQIYALADVFILPSINETWGLVVNEAMNAGCAIIVTDQVGCASDLVIDEVNGFIVEAHDHDALTAALAKTLLGGRYRAMGRKSLKIISEWDIQKNIEGMQAVLEKWRSADEV